MKRTAKLRTLDVITITSYDSTKTLDETDSQAQNIGRYYYYVL